MPYFLFIIKSAVEDFRRNKVRTALTSLGVLIGVSSVILLIAFGLGLKGYIRSQFENLGTNLIIVLPGKVLQGRGFRPGGGVLGGTRFDGQDVANLAKLKHASFVVPVFVKTVTVRANGNTEITDLYATTTDIFSIRNLEAKVGETFEKSDVEKRSKVVVIGPTIAEKIFGSKEVIGRVVKIEGQSFRVVGVLSAKGGSFGGPDFDSFIYLPHTAALSFNPDKKFFAIYVKGESEPTLSQLKQEMKDVLLRRYKEDDFSVVEQTEIIEVVSSIFSILNTVLIAIAAISLIVGGVGIMNIMYVSAVERIREIGIRRAIGATKKDILYQFLTEAVILSLLGGILGLTLSFIIVLFIQRFFPAYINLVSVLVALGVSSSIGIIFGVFPAKKAADLSPIEAIRHE